ncbi:MAG: PLDc N-terminal domain-containing protein [Chloroflexi bacterium]|nr:PLDc N-terminal domain-containing protein [Chloroflexota bacterium]
MEPIRIVEVTSSNINGLAVLIASVYFGVSALLVIGGALIYRRSDDKTVRAIVGAAIVGGLVLILTGVIGPVLNTQVVLPFILLEIGLLGTFLWAAILVDCATREPNQGNDKLVWVIIIVFTSLIGAALYFFIRRPQRLIEVGR